MNRAKLIENFEKNGFSVKYFDTKEQAAEYLKGELKGETIGFGGSLTSQQMGLYELLGEENTVCWHWKNPADIKRFPEFTAYITSANGVAETGELVNIDGAGNRVSATLYGPAKLYFICGENKVTPDLPSAIERARNIAAPLNAKRLNKKTPCAQTGKCMNCNSPERICRAMVIHMRPMMPMQKTEVIFVGEALGM